MTFGFLLILVTLLAIFGFSAVFERTLISAPTILSGSLLLPIILFKIELTVLTLLILLGSAVGFGIAYYAIVYCSLLTHRTTNSVPDNAESGDQGLIFSLLLFFLVAQAAFLHNLLQVFLTLGIDAYVSQSSKVIELTFGQSTITNYLFFINIPVAAIAAFMVGSRRHGLLVRLIWIISATSLAFSGIKSTFIFGGSISVFAYILGRGRLSVVALSVMVILAATAVAVMFAFVNLGISYDSQNIALAALAPQLAVLLEGYIEYNYLNLEKEILERTDFTWGKFTFFFMTKLFNPEIKGYFDVSAFLVIDKNYNMGTYLREYFVDFGAVGALGVPFVLGAICGFVRVWYLRNRSVAACVTLSVLLTACLFAFFGNQFIRLQFIYAIFIGIAIQQSGSLLLGLHASNGRV